MITALIAIGIMWVGWVSFTLSEVDRTQNSVQSTQKAHDARITLNTTNLYAIDDTDRHTGFDEEKNIKHQGVIDSEQTRRIKRLEDIMDRGCIGTNSE